VVWFTVFETYLIHLNIGPDLVPDRDQTLTLCGRIRNLLREAGPDKMYYLNDISIEIIANRTQKLIEINSIINRYPFELLYNFPIAIESDLFMEVLLNNLRNELTSYQFFIENFKNSEYRNAVLLLSEIKEPERRDCIEDKISRLNDIRIRDRLLHSNIYDIVNNEKMTPHFLNLSKISANTGSLSDIKMDSGANFADQSSLRQHIITEYEKIYGTQGPDSSVLDIENFLGPDITNHEIVRNSKLPPEIKNELDLDLSLAELDKSMNDAKFSSAGGMDGLNNRTLKRLWPVLRVPLFNYSKKITDTGRLTPTFKVASIKLIPKKGDLSRLKNWRPISLLNCIYKIISRAVNNRLQKIAPIILSRAQKGFIKNRFIQECLINVIEKISHCNYRNIPALVVAIDQSRAFDTVNHSYMTSVYQFFNFGERFISLMNAIGTGREACFLWEDGSYSGSFKLKTGRAQGDGPSPLQYNFAEQILLFRLELDGRISPALDAAVVADRIPVPVSWFRPESKKKQTKWKLWPILTADSVAYKICIIKRLKKSRLLHASGHGFG
jgi:hypothetical protein